MGQERRTHSSVAAAALVHPLPAMDINTSQKSKSQSKRLRDVTFLDFNVWQICLSYLCPITCTNATACILIGEKRKLNALDVPHVDLVGFLFFRCHFFTP